MIESDVPESIKSQFLQDFYVICSVSGDKIPLPQLLYWNVDKQVAYRGPDVIDPEEFPPYSVDISLDDTKDGS